jgi:hypothetical protein
VPIVVIVIAISGIDFSVASTCRTLLSLYSRLDPTGVLRRSEMKLSSASGTNSVPTSGTMAKLAKNATSASAMTLLRCESAHSRMTP